MEDPEITIEPEAKPDLTTEAIPNENIIPIDLPIESQANLKRWIGKLAGTTDASITFSDITTNNVSITKHGFAPKAPNDATKYLDGTGVYSIPAGTTTDATISTSDITTNNVSTSKHGWAPKAPNDSSKFLDGTGAYSVPSVGSFSSRLYVTGQAIVSGVNQFPTTVIDNNTEWDGTNYRWVAKIAGTYMVSTGFTLSYNSQTSTVNWAIRKNTSTTLFNAFASVDSVATIDTGAGTVMASMSVNDYFDIGASHVNNGSIGSDAYMVVWRIA